MVSIFPFFSVYFYLLLKFIFKNSQREIHFLVCCSRKAGLSDECTQSCSHNHHQDTERAITPKTPLHRPFGDQSLLDPQLLEHWSASCSRNSTLSMIPSKWNPTLLSLVSLAFFTKLSASESQSGYHTDGYLTLLYWVVSTDAPWFIYPFTSWRTAELFPGFGSCE